jgi:hypothetical protein
VAVDRDRTVRTVEGPDGGARIAIGGVAFVDRAER